MLTLMLDCESCILEDFNSQASLARSLVHFLIMFTFPHLACDSGMMRNYVFTCFVLDNVLGPLFAMTSHVTICAVLELTRAATAREDVPECADFRKQLRMVGSVSPRH